MKLHLRYRHIRPEAVATTERLFALKPWRIKDEPDAEATLTGLTQAWADEMTRIYDVPHLSVAVDSKQGPRYGVYVPTGFVIDEEGDPYGMSEGQIVLGQFSLTNLLWHFATHLHHHGALSGGNRASSNSFATPFSWAISLFYTVRPVMFRARVREGRIAGMTGRDTLSRATIAAMLDAGINPDQPTALEALRGAEAEAVSLDEPPVDEAEVMAEVDSFTATFMGANQIANMNVRPLRRYATEHGITGAWSMSKPQLLVALGVTVS